jgi:Mg-chelatase subunit ChlD
MKFLQLFTGRRDVVPVRPQLALTVAAGFSEDSALRIPRARLCASLRKELNVAAGSVLKVSYNGNLVNCRVAVSSTEDEGKELIRLNPRAREQLRVELGHQAQVFVNTSPLSSSAVPLEVAPAMKGDEVDAEPVVRLSKPMRDNLGLSSGDYVAVKGGENQVPMRVEVGAKGDRAVARLNPMARGMLQVVVGDLVELVPHETLMLLIDASGSMEESLGFRTSKMRATREAIHKLLQSKQQAKERDLVGLVTFGDECDLVSEPLDDFDLLKNCVKQLRPNGRTAMFEGLAYTLELLEDASGLRRAILLSDGCPTTTGSNLVLELAHKAKQMGVVIDTIGVGRSGNSTHLSYDEPLLRRIAELTGGKFTPVGDVQVLEEEFLSLSESKKIPLLTDGLM